MIFKYPQIDDEEVEIIKELGVLRDRLRYVTTPTKRWFGILRRDAQARAVKGSNSIEGYNVSKDDAVAAVMGEEPFDARSETWKVTLGYQKAMTYVLQRAEDPYFAYSTELIRSLHYMMIEYDLSKYPGRWRPGAINVVDEAKQEIVYVAPDVELISSLMEELTVFLNTQDKEAPTLIKAAMAHLNLVMIHPFRDGNGRMGRCLQALVLARDGVLAAPFCSIEEYLGDNTPSYYEILKRVGTGAWHPENDAKPWVRFCLNAHYVQAHTVLRRTNEMMKTWEELEKEVKKYKLQERVIYALVDAAYGYKVRNSTYRSMADISDQLASRDLKQLVEQGLLQDVGAARGRHYIGTALVKDIRDRNREKKLIELPLAV